MKRSTWEAMASKRLDFQKKSMKRSDSLLARWIWKNLKRMMAQETTEKKMRISRTIFTMMPAPVNKATECTSDRRVKDKNLIPTGDQVKLKKQGKSVEFRPAVVETGDP